MPMGKVWICHYLWFCVCLFVRLRISPARIKLAAFNFARWFIGVLGRKSPILGNFASSEAQNRTNRRAAASAADRHQPPRLTVSARGTPGHALGIVVAWRRGSVVGLDQRS